MYIQCTNYIKQNLNFALRSHHHFPLYRVSEGPCNGDFQLLEYQAGLYCIHFFSQNENTSILNETWHWHVLISFVLKVFQGVYLPSLLRLSPGWRILIPDSYSINSLPKASPTHSGIEPDTETLQGHTIFLFKKIVFVLFSPGMKAGVHFSGGFFWTGCILRDFFIVLTWDPRGCLTRTTRWGRNQIFTFSIYSTLSTVIITGDTTEINVFSFRFSCELFLLKSMAKHVINLGRFKYEKHQATSSLNI